MECGRGSGVVDGWGDGEEGKWWLDVRKGVGDKLGIDKGCDGRAGGGTGGEGRKRGKGVSGEWACWVRGCVCVCVCVSV